MQSRERPIDVKELEQAGRTLRTDTLYGLGDFHCGAVTKCGNVRAKSAERIKKAKGGDTETLSGLKSQLRNAHSWTRFILIHCVWQLATSDKAVQGGVNI